MISGTLASKLPRSENIRPISPDGVTFDNDDRMTMEGVYEIIPMKGPTMKIFFS